MYSSLGQAQATPREEEIFRRLYDLSRQYFPGETAKAESWLQGQATKYGLVYAKIKAEEQGRSIWNNPLTWLGISLGAMLLLRK